MAMEHGDISNQLLPRLLVEWENLLGIPPQDAKFWKDPYRVRRSWRLKDPLSRWQLNELAAKAITNRSWLDCQEYEVITLGPPEFAEELAKYLDRQAIPVRSVWSYDPTALGKNLPNMKHVAAIYTANPLHILKYGSWGRLVTEHNVTEIGRF